MESEKDVMISLTGVPEESNQTLQANRLLVEFLPNLRFPIFTNITFHISEEVFPAAASMTEKAGLGSCFMGIPGEQAKFVGHGVGNFHRTTTVGPELDELYVLAKGFTDEFRHRTISSRLFFI
jgi:hypothetical protein